ncbi:class I SAM-dependent methyltransferase [Portibacter marinus]|uniref:class I SAM-dependent methyltransferase n=1 Tax=Portibacter marinus TaxID=2898660 RepID=UPI001F1B82BE|nr:methyltransferase domain-containing protein [Portibacter marinus]
MTRKFGIKKGYIHRKNVDHFNDLSNTDHYQDEVYKYAFELLTKFNYNSIVDIGCGSGYKLRKYFKDYEYIGVEVEPTLSELRKMFDSAKYKTFEEIRGHNFDIIICSDVIEHVENPSAFILQIINDIKFKHLVLSTPERDLVRGRYDYGPPKNKFHYREWNSLEFQDFLSTYLRVKEHLIVDHNQGTQLAHCLNQKLNNQSS